MMGEDKRWALEDEVERETKSIVDEDKWGRWVEKEKIKRQKYPYICRLNDR